MTDQLVDVDTEAIVDDMPLRIDDDHPRRATSAVVPHRARQMVRDHPAMLLSLNELGSVVLDVAANRIDARFIDQNGSILDHFTMTKGAVALPPALFHPRYY